MLHRDNAEARLCYSGGISLSPPWTELDKSALAAARDRLVGILAAVGKPEALNEAQTEERIIRPILAVLGWDGAFSVQTKIGKANVSDYTLFATPDAFAHADAAKNHDDKLKHAVAVADAKAWSVGLDQPGGGAGKGETPAAQILRYLFRAGTVSNRAVRFAVFTNGRRWRLYFSGAKSLLDDTFEVDLAWLLGLPGTQGTLDAGVQHAAGADRLLKISLLVFRRQAFLPSAALSGRTFHIFARDEGRLWETKVRTSLAEVVFEARADAARRAAILGDVARPEPLRAGRLGARLQGGHLAYQRARHDRRDRAGSRLWQHAARRLAGTKLRSWFIVEQLPVVPPESFYRRFGPLTAAEIVRDHVLRLSYTAHDLAPFARDLGHVAADGFPLPPFPWDEAVRRQLRARLDALFFHLYGLTDEDDVRHVLATFPIVRRKDEAAFGCYLTEELILWHHHALAAGDPARDAPEAEIIEDTRRSA